MLLEFINEQMTVIHSQADITHIDPCHHRCKTDWTAAKRPDTFTWKSRL